VAWYKFEEERLFKFMTEVFIFSQQDPPLVTRKVSFGMALTALDKIYHIFTAEKRKG
jgi:hypothetical protein